MQFIILFLYNFIFIIEKHLSDIKNTYTKQEMISWMVKHLSYMTLYIYPDAKT